MALSKEYTYWHLTPNGWIAGDTKTDFGNKSVEQPKDTVLTIIYNEVINHGIKIEKSTERQEISKDIAFIKSLETQFPFIGNIEPAN